MRVVTVHIYLAEHVKLDSVAGSKRFNLCVCTGLLTSELIAWESENAQPVLCVLVVQTDQLLVIHVRLSSFTRDIDDYTTFPRVVLHGDRTAINVISIERVNVGSGLIIGGGHGGDSAPADV